MEPTGKVIVVTGGANGIGAAMCARFAAAGAEAVVVSDVDLLAAQQLAASLPNAIAIGCDVSDESAVQNLVAQTIERCGRIDVFCSNAGITVKGGLSSSNDEWQSMWDINVMSRVFAARAVVPHMLERGDGYLINTASAAGLLTEIGSASYSATKHADLAFSEWLSVRYGREGIDVSCVCPLGVQTDFIDEEDPIHRYLHLHSITPEDVADSIVAGMSEKRFLILPHPEVAEFYTLKSDDHDRWLRGMQRLRQKLTRPPRRKAA